MDANAMLEYLISIGEITQERFDELVKEKEKELAVNPPSFVADVKGQAQELDTRTLEMQEIDRFTLDNTFLIDQKTEEMKDIDSYTLDLVFALMDRVTALENK